MDAPVTVLMYHAVADGERARRHADAHYSVPVAAFEAQLAIVREAGGAAASVADILAGRARGARVAFTFDDGHESNARAALRLRETGANADLFVNPGRAGASGFLDWRALADLAAAGVSIQSHGLNHRYLDELDEAEIRRELAASKAAIEDATGKPVSVFAPPGGRLTPAVTGLAREAGYRALCTSRAGIWRAADGEWAIPRLAVLAGTAPDRFGRWVAQDAVELARLRLRHGVLSAAKRALGNRLYDRLRGVVLDGGADA